MSKAEVHTSVRVVTVLRGWDMRARHASRVRWMNRLRAGEAVVLFNGALTIARIIDAQGGVHDYYTAPHEKFDEGMLYNMVERGIRLMLTVGKSEAMSAARWEGIRPPPAPQLLKAGEPA